EAIDSEGAALGRTVQALLEVNISGDATKHGLQPAEVPLLLPKLASLSNLRVGGLMTMSHREGGSAVARADFARLRELRDQLRQTIPEAASLNELSMGMSDDFEEAILEGATMIRVGSALFQGLEP